MTTKSRRCTATPLAVSLILLASAAKGLRGHDRRDRRALPADLVHDSPALRPRAGEVDGETRRRIRIRRHIMTNLLVAAVLSLMMGMTAFGLALLYETSLSSAFLIGAATLAYLLCISAISATIAWDNMDKR